MRILKQLLKEYNIDYHDERKMNMLIKELSPRPVPYISWRGIEYAVTLGLLPILGHCWEYVFEHAETTYELGEIIEVALFIVFAVIAVMIIMPTVKYVFDGEARWRERLINDLHTIMVFGDALETRVLVDTFSPSSPHTPSRFSPLS